MKAALFFTLCLGFVAAIFLQQTIGLGGAARMVPLSVIVPTGALLLVQLILDLRTSISPDGSKQRPYAELRYEREPQPSLPSVNQNREEAHRDRLARELWLISSLAGLLLATYILGPLAGGCVYLLLYLHYVTRIRWLEAIGATTLAALLAYTCFRLLMNVNFPPAQLLIWLGVNAR